jgi:hypothetical protein
MALADRCGHGSGLPSEREKGGEVGFRNAHKTANAVYRKSACLDPAPYGPLADVEARRHVGDRDEGHVLTAPIVHRVRYARLQPCLAPG